MQGKRNPTGIRVRHRQECASDEGRRCNCKPAYEAWVFSKREGRKLRKTFPTLAAAKAWRADALAEIRQGTLRAATTITLRGAAQGWLSGARGGIVRNRSGDRYKPSTLRGYEAALRDRVLPILGGYQLVEIRRGDLQSLVKRMQAEGVSPSTIRNALLPVRAIYREAMALDQVAVNPTSGLSLPAVRGVRDRIASPIEAMSLLAAVPEQDRALWTTAMYAGLRSGELQALQWSDVDFKAGILTVRRSWDRVAGPVKPKSRAGQRTVPMAARMRVALVEHRLRRGRPLSGLVFGRSEARPFQPSSVLSRARRAWRRAGLDSITLHECRHTFASLMIAAGVNAKALSSFMGHASITMTMDRYGHLMPGSEAEAATLLDGYLDSEAKSA